MSASFERGLTEDLRQWHAPEGLAPEIVAGDVCVDGSCEVHMRKEATPAGERYPELSIERGTYKVIVPNELLVFTSCGDWIPDETTRVRVEFHDVAEGTEIVLTQTLFVTAGSREGHRFGWGGALAKLGALIDGLGGGVAGNGDGY